MTLRRGFTTLEVTKKLQSKIWFYYKNIVGYDKINFDKTKPDGNPRKLLDSSKIKKIRMGTENKTTKWFKNNMSGI